MHLAGFEPTIPACERPQTHASYRAATGIGVEGIYMGVYTCIRVYTDENMELHAPTEQDYTFTLERPRLGYECIELYFRNLYTSWRGAWAYNLNFILNAHLRIHHCLLCILP